MSSLRAAALIFMSLVLSACGQKGSTLAGYGDGTAHFIIDPARTQQPVVGGNLVATLRRLERGLQQVSLQFNFINADNSLTTGDQQVAIPAAFFTQEFLDELRTKQILQEPPYTAQHLAQADITTMNGQTFKLADEVQIRGIPNDPRGHRIDDLVVTLWMFPGLPAIGAAKIDLTGVHSGHLARIGADLE